MEKLSNIIAAIESLAPPVYQESYDNSGLITGNGEMEIKGALICLDSTENVIDEAIKNGCNLVISHHPVIFSGIKKLNGKNYVERVLIKAIKNDIAIYAVHTNLDNIRLGVNNMICNRLGLTDTRILAPVHGLLKKLVTYCPEKDSPSVKAALFEAGAGSIGNYDECSFSAPGTGTFRGNEHSNPAIGSRGKREMVTEERIEVIFESRRQQTLLQALKSAHPYEEVAFDIYSLDNQHQNVGAGMIGYLKEPLGVESFLRHVKTTMLTECIRYTSVNKTTIEKVAVCGGSGSFLLGHAIEAGADALVTSDFKYHQFFDGEQKILIADIGHYESEQFTKELLYSFLKEKFTTFALRLSETNTNPINYF